MHCSSLQSSIGEVTHTHTVARLYVFACVVVAHHLLMSTHVCSSSGRFRVVDTGNTPVGNSELAAFSRVCPWLRSSLHLLADVAYVSDSRCRCPYKAPLLTVESAGSFAAAQKRRAYNQRLSSTRQRVEHAFSRMKHTWRMLQSSWHFPLDQLPRTVRAAALLCNWLLRNRDLYNNDAI